MNKYSVFLVPVIMIFFLSNSFQQKKNHRPVPEGISRWTGTVTFVEIINITNAAYTATGERHIIASFNDALPTMYRDDDATELNFTDDKGTGSHTFHSEGRFIGGRTCVTDCQSSDKAELHAVVINEEANAYDIEVVSPNCIGTTCGDDGGTKEYGPESRSVTVSNHPLTSKDVLAGSITVTAELPGGLGTATTTTTWHLVRSTNVNVELIVTPEDYDNWLPEPGQNELTKGTVIKINLKVYGRNGQPPASKAKSFELTLSNTSKEPGITINSPLVPLTTLPDLRFLPQANAGIGEEFQLAKVKCTDGASGDISIGAFDGGAYATLTAVAILEDNSRIEGHLLISGGNTGIPIPKRPAGSKIAVAWLVANNNPGDMDDNETSTGNTNDGDGLTAYEEYRGVISEGGFHRLDPHKKEVGVKMKRAEITIFSDGLSKFENATGLKVIRFGENEIGQDRRFNKNFLTAHIYNQNALFLQKGTLTSDLGKSFGGPAIPKQVSKTVIDQNRIMLSYQDRLAEARSINTALTYTEKDLFATVTAHELCHSVNVKHHGSLAPNSLNLEIQPGRPVRIFDYNGIEIIRRPYPITGRGGDTGNEQSGDVNCFMLNNALCDWAVKTTPDSMFFYEVPLIPLGTSLCTKPNGTGLNSLKDANGNYKYFGDAANGNCLSQIKLK
jgi:hypothetical protein